MTITQFFHGWKAGELSNLFVRECWNVGMFSNFFVMKHLHVFT